MNDPNMKTLGRRSPTTWTPEETAHWYQQTFGSYATQRLLRAFEAAATHASATRRADAQRYLAALRVLTGGR